MFCYKINRINILFFVTKLDTPNAILQNQKKFNHKKVSCVLRNARWYIQLYTARKIRNNL